MCANCTFSLRIDFIVDYGSNIVVSCRNSKRHYMVILNDHIVINQ